ncbi:PREDICTED: uncharacterized protein LOC108559195 [Nicrophorus vespilloides]|uniref:Uncharacterized protein LOC108559195 n=1 Tax=Nicrophorus vespilloides TaxID=110193 RepID=A0ABM1MBB6_NICVS|nr:PREDICTED: uncharacterized protein LOC108559195 [Nicrophorus vespilloides]XP_017771865.1 PREDICTED: uncharacterized protein LOC108559195 [Nicrophorus vespilloides]XP_017771866.1 PREDICTED: uncharacterized protein LOC108559195 [Nicrophorus vespilloides]
MVLQMIQSRSIALGAKLRFPAIKFRYGGNKSAAPAHTIASPTASAPPAKAQAAASAASIYDFQLPLRYKRKPIEQEEIDYINRGGPA